MMTSKSKQTRFQGPGGARARNSSVGRRRTTPKPSAFPRERSCPRTTGPSVACPRITTECTCRGVCMLEDTRQPCHMAGTLVAYSGGPPTHHSVPLLAEAAACWKHMTALSNGALVAKSGLYIHQSILQLRNVFGGPRSTTSALNLQPSALLSEQEVNRLCMHSDPRQGSHSLELIDRRGAAEHQQRLNASRACTFTGSGSKFTHVSTLLQ